MVTPRFFPYTGGIEMHVYQLARRLARTEANITVLTTDLERQLPVSEKLEGINVRRVPAWPAKRDYYFAPAIYPQITHGQWDLVHVHSYNTFVAPLAMLAALRGHRPYVVTFHGGGHSSRLRNAIRKPQLMMLRPLLARASRLITLAQFEIPLYGRRLRLPAERFVRIPDGSDFVGSVPLALEPTNGTLIVSVGRLERFKGHQRAIAALPSVLIQRPDARLRIVGRGPYESELKRLAKRLGVAERVEIRAVPPEDRQGLAALLRRAALVTLFSEYETSPLSAFEALASGCSLLVADSSGLREIANKGWARAVPLNSTSEQLAAAILEQLSHPLTPPPITMPTWDESAQALLKVYEDITGSARCTS
jgi:glycosyltransferase involved in cell wall biosynthesis